MKRVYVYDWQGDNVLIARENLLYTFIDYYKEGAEWVKIVSSNLKKAGSEM